MSDDNYELRFKIAIIGDDKVGKTCFFSRYLNDVYSSNYKATIGAEFGEKSININDKIIKLVIWDTAGQEIFQALAETFYKGAKGVILMYDITNQESFKKLRNRIEELRENEPQAIIFLVGNKCDKPDRIVTEEEGKKLAEEYNIEIYETSAKTGQNVNEIFYHLTKKIVKDEIDEIDGIDNNINEKLENYDQNQKINENDINEIKKDKINYSNQTNLESIKDLENKYNEEVNKNKKLEEENKILKEKINNITKSHSEEIDKLKEEINKLNNNLLKANKIISNYQNNENKNIDNNRENNKFLEKEIFNLKNQLNNKRNEIDELKQKLKKNSIIDDKISIDDIMVLNFVSTDQVIHRGIKCLPNDTFAEVEEKLYKIYDEYRDTNNLCTSNAKPILRFKKICENGIKDGDVIQLVKIE